MKKLSGILAILLAVSCLFCSCKSVEETPTSSDSSATTTSKSNDVNDTDTTTGSEDTTGTTSSQDGQTVSTKPIEGGLPGGDDVQSQVDNLGTYQFPKRNGITGTVKVFIPWDVDARYERLKKEFEAMYPGTTVEYITSPWNTRTTKLANQIKAKKAPDCVSTAYMDFPTRAIKNLVQPLDEYLVKGDTLNMTIMENVTSYNGKHYALMRNQYPYVIYYNTDMFEEYGEKTPLEYYNEGKWNWNTFRTVAANMTDVQNGKVNTYGFGIDDETIFMLAMQTDLIKFENGMPKLNTTDPKFTSSLDFFYKMCNTDKSVYAERWLNFNAFLEEKIAMSYWRADQDTIDRLAKAKVEWEIVPFPMAEGATAYYGIAAGDGWSLGYGCANPQGGMAFAEFEINDRAKLNMNIAFSADQKKRMSSIIGTVSFLNCYGLDISFNNGFCNAMRNNGSMPAKLEEYKPEWETLINDVINGN